MEDTRHCVVVPVAVPSRVVDTHVLPVYDATENAVTVTVGAGEVVGGDSVVVGGPAVVGGPNDEVGFAVMISAHVTETEPIIFVKTFVQTPSSAPIAVVVTVPEQPSLLWK